MVIKHYHEVLPPNKTAPQYEQECFNRNRKTTIGPTVVLHLNQPKKEEYITYNRYGQIEKI